MRAYGTIEPKEVEVPVEERLSKVESLINPDEFEKSMSARFAQADIRNRGLWKQDIQAALRGQLNDLVSNVEGSVKESIRKEVTEQISSYKEAHERSQQQVRELVSKRDETIKSDREDFTKGMENTITAMVLKILQDYWIIDSEGHVLDVLQRPASCRYCEAKQNESRP